MPWVKLDDAFPEHPKILAVGGNAAWLHVCALAYANRNLTDGHIPASVLQRLSDRKNSRALAERLVAAGLWETNGDGWNIHDFLEYQTSKVRVEEERAKARERMANARNGHTHDSGNVRANKSRSSPTVTPTRRQIETEVENDDDTLANSQAAMNGHPSSSFNRETTRNTLATAAATALADKRANLTNRNGWIKRTAEGLIRERPDDLDRCIDNGYTISAAIELLTSSPTAPPLKEAWYADPRCDQCDGEGWVTDHNGFLVECSCRQREPYPDPKKRSLRSVK